MEIPICIDGKRAGTLAIEGRGGGLFLDARMTDPGRVVRLRVFGEREFYLGVPVPEETGQLRLTRRLSPSEARRFPRRPGYAAESPRREPDEPASAPQEEAGRRRVLWLGGRPYYF